LVGEHVDDAFSSVAKYALRAGPLEALWTTPSC
jgi:hypothetical protein